MLETEARPCLLIAPVAQEPTLGRSGEHSLRKTRTDLEHRQGSKSGTLDYQVA
jgi:hypothetical protein